MRLRLWSRARLIRNSKSGTNSDNPTFNLTIHVADCVLDVTETREESTGFSNSNIA
jgi:hypothetical protein